MYRVVCSARRQISTTANCVLASLVTRRFREVANPSPAPNFPREYLVRCSTTRSCAGASKYTTSVRDRSLTDMLNSHATTTMAEHANY